MSEQTINLYMKKDNHMEERRPCGLRLLDTHEIKQAQCYFDVIKIKECVSFAAVEFEVNAMMS